MLQKLSLGLGILAAASLILAIVLSGISNEPKPVLATVSIWTATGAIVLGLISIVSSLIKKIPLAKSGMIGTVLGFIVIAILTYLTPVSSEIIALPG